MNGTGLRFTLFYAAFFLGFGAFLPLLPVWLETRGLSPEAVGLALAAGTLGRLFAAPIGGLWSDRAYRQRDVLVAFACASAALFIVHWPIHHTGILIILSALAGFSFTGLIPISDAFAMKQSRQAGFVFGIPRAFGSGAFVVGNITAGALVSLYGGEVIMLWIIAASLILAAAAFLLPPGHRPPGPMPLPYQGIGELLGQGLPLAFAASALIQCAHGFYYGFSAITWRDQGINEAMTGILWGVGVGAEVIFFLVSTRLFGRWRPSHLMVVGGALSLVRWGALALSPPLWLLIPLQGLHAFSFAASYFGFLRYASDHAPPRFAATAQAVNSAFSGGIALALSYAASGWLHDHFGAYGFAFMMLPAGAGLIFAIILQHKKSVLP